MFTFALMKVETLGMARSLVWKVHMRCADGYREGTKSMRRCIYRNQLDLNTHVALHTRTELPAFALRDAPYVSDLWKLLRNRPSNRRRTDGSRVPAEPASPGRGPAPSGPDQPTMTNSARLR